MYNMEMVTGVEEYLTENYNMIAEYLAKSKNYIMMASVSV